MYHDWICTKNAFEDALKMYLKMTLLRYDSVGMYGDCKEHEFGYTFVSVSTCVGDTKGILYMAINYKVTMPYFLCLFLANLVFIMQITPSCLELHY